MRKKLRLIAGGTVAAVAMSITGLTGLATPASAQEAEDVAIIIENLPIAASTLSKGVENALDKYNETQNFELAYKELFAPGPNGSAGPQGAGAGVRNALADLFWGISLQGVPHSGSAVGYVLATLVGSSSGAYGSALTGSLMPIVAYLDDQQPIIDSLEDPTALQCRDIVATPTRSFPCEIMSVAQAQALGEAAPNAVLGIADEFLSCVGQVIDGNSRAAIGCPGYNLFGYLSALENAYPFRPNQTTTPWTPIWNLASSHGTMSFVAASLGGTLVPEEVATAIDDLTAEIADVTGPLNDALREVDLNGDGF